MCREGWTRGLCGGEPSHGVMETMTWLIAGVAGGLLRVVATLLGWLSLPVTWGQPEPRCLPIPTWKGLPTLA